MDENDEVSGGDFADTSYVPTGPRRSTFTPPSGKYPSLFDKAEDDKAEDAAEAATPEVPRAEPPAEKTSSAETSVPEQPSTQPHEAAAPSSELPDRPRRQSLQDDELLRALSPDAQQPANTLASIEHLQAELELRQREAQDFSQWEGRMRAIGTPEALESIAEAIPEFTGVIPIIPPQPAPEPSSPGAPSAEPPGHEPSGHEPSGVEPPAAQSAAAPVAPESLSEPSTQTAVSEPFLDPEQFPPPRLEERVHIGPLAEPNLSDDLVFLPPWMIDTPAEAAPSTEEVTPTEAASPEGVAQEDKASATSDDAAPEDAVADEATSHDEAADDGAVSDVAAAPDDPAMDDAAMDAPEGPSAPVLYDLVDPSSPDRLIPPLSDAKVEESPQTIFPVEPQPEVSAEPEPEASAEAEPEAEPEQAPSADSQPGPSPFDALLAGDADTVSGDTEPRPFSLLDTPPDSEPILTGSQAIIIPAIQGEPDDEVDETDRAFGDPIGAYPVDAEGVAAIPPTTGSAPIQPVATPRIPTSEQVIVDAEPAKAPLFSLELSTVEATPVEQRVGRAARMFWLWFATNSSLVSVAFGAALFGLGMSLRQAILAVFIGVAISFLPLGLGTLAGKWSGQPTIVVSRATFGLVGNIVPAILTLVVRLFWGAVLLWLVAVCTARILAGASLGGPFDETQLAFLAAGVGFVLALVVALFGYHLFARLQLILSIASAILIVGLLAVTWHEVDIRTALTVGDGPWILVVTGVVLVFSFIGLVWANSSGDIARYQRPAGSGAAASLWASFGATLPAFLLIAYGALLAASNRSAAAGLLARPLDTIALMIPTWYPVPLLAATVLSLLSGVALSIYSGGFALSAVGLRLSRPWTVVISGVVLFVITIAVVLSDAGITEVFRDIATSLAVPVAAWAGIFAAEVMIRRKRFDEASLLAPGGIYPAVNWVNLVMLFVASAIGFGFTTASVSWLSWQGYGFALFGFPLHGEIAASDLGVLVALVLGILTPLAAGVSTVRLQESSRR